MSIERVARIGAAILWSAIAAVLSVDLLALLALGLSAAALLFVIVLASIAVAWALTRRGGRKAPATSLVGGIVLCGTALWAVANSSSDATAANEAIAVAALGIIAFSTIAVLGFRR